MNRFGKWVIRYRIAIIILWVLLLIPGSYGMLKLPEILRGEASSPQGSEMFRQEQLITHEFPEQTISNIVVILESSKYQINDSQYQALIEKILNIVEQYGDQVVPVTYQQDPAMLDSSQKKTYLLLNFKTGEYKEADRLALELREKLNALPLSDDFKLYLTGGPLFTRAITEMGAEDGFNTEKRIIPLVLIVLILVFGGIIAACLPLLTGLVSTTLTLGLLYPLAHMIEITSMAQNITSMIGLGVGIDYSLLIVNRFREEMTVNECTKEEAAIRTINSAGRTILYSGMVVSIGMFALLLPNVVFMQSLGLSGLIVVIITILIGLTLLPSLLSLLGNHINAPHTFSRWAHQVWGSSRFWYNWGKYIMTRPIFFTFVSTAVLICISLFTFDLKLSSISILFMPKEMEARQGFEKLVELDPKHTFSPIILTFESKDDTPIWQEKNLREIYNFVTTVYHQEPIFQVIGILNPGSSLNFDEQMTLYHTVAAYGGVANMRLFQANFSLPFISQDEKKAIVALFHDYKGYETATEGAADIETIASIRKYRDQYQSQFANMNVLVGGLSAIPLEMKKAIYDHFPFIIIFILIVTYILTMFSFGSLILPLKAIFLNVLSVTATYGVMVLVLQKGLFASWLGVETVPGSLMIVTPMILFCIIFGLSMDYEIFLINRMREEYDTHGNPEEAIAAGLEKTGGIITNAALIMILVFMGFAFARMIIVKEFGLGLATAIFIDATIIRIMIVPAFMKLLGRSCWYFPKALNIPFLNRLFRH